MSISEIPLEGSIAGAVGRHQDVFEVLRGLICDEHHKLSPEARNDPERVAQAILRIPELRALIEVGERHVKSTLGLNRAREQRREQRLSELTPEMVRAREALGQGPLKATIHGFVEPNGAIHFYSTVHALARRGMAAIDKTGACLIPKEVTA